MNMINYKKFFLLAAVCFFGLGYQAEILSVSVLNHLLTPELTDETAPWFTGPLLAPSARTIPQGHVNVEPYIFFFATTGVYNAEKDYVAIPNFYTLQEITPVQVGLTSFLDCSITPSLSYQFTQGARSTQAGDIPFSVGVQLYRDTPGTHLPAIKLSLRASGPTGKYDQLDPKKLGTDAVGTGSWMPTIGLNFARLYQGREGHFLAPRLSFSYTIPGSVPVKGINTYGGAPDTAATVHVGPIFSCDLGLEYNITRNWAAALDVLYVHKNKTTFSGFPGTLASLGGPASEQLSLAPAFEYNWNINVGIIAGVWFTVFGKNSGAFTTGAVAINLYL